MGSAREIHVVERMNGEVYRDEKVPVVVCYERGRKGEARFYYGDNLGNGHKEHLQAFAAVMRASGGKFWPGTKQWEVAADRRDAIVEALRADGFEVDLSVWGEQ